MLHHVHAGPHEKVIRVTQNNLRVELAKLTRTDCFYTALRADRHEYRRFDYAMRRGKLPAACAATGINANQLEHQPLWSDVALENARFRATARFERFVAVVCDRR